MEQVRHFAHPKEFGGDHKLILLIEELNERKRDYISRFRCHACCHQITFPAYVCEDCFYIVPKEIDLNKLPPADNHNILSILEMKYNFLLHKSCFELSSEIEYIHHPKHKLTLRSPNTPDSELCICDACEYIFHGFSYHCSECEFVICVQCVSLKRRFHYQQRLKSKESKKVYHFSHLHPLIFCKSVSRVSLYEEYCRICLLPLSTESYGYDPCYGCVDCNFFIHKSCKDMPRSIIHPAHDLSHGPLWMPDYATEIRILRPCNLCENKRELKFRCLSCKFELHMNCAYTAMCTFKNECHPSHGIVYQHKVLPSNNCNACGLVMDSRKEDKDDDLYRCASCSECFHFHCVSIPSTVKHKYHIHPLLLTNLIVEDIYYVHYCDICETPRNPKHYRYSCEQCSFAAHIHCTLYQEDSSSKMSFSLIPYIEDVNYIEETKTLLTQSSEVSHYHHLHNKCSYHLTRLHNMFAFYMCDSCRNVFNGTRYYCRKCKLTLDETCFSLTENETKTTEIFPSKQHFTHEHALISTNFRAIKIKRCSICMMWLKGQTYSCIECSYHCHKSCLKYPDKYFHPSFDSPHSIHFSEFYGDCHICGTPIDPSGYDCAICKLKFHVKCLDFLVHILKDTIQQHSFYHFPHEYYRTLNRSHRLEFLCHICKSNCTGSLYRCAECKSNVHPKCLDLPRIVKHKCHWHPLILMDSLPQDASGEYYCNVCEMERHPNLPVYYCQECTFEAHLQCILLENKSWNVRFNLIENEDAKQKKTLIILDENGAEIEEHNEVNVNGVKEDAFEKYFRRIYKPTPTELLISPLCKATLTELSSSEDEMSYPELNFGDYFGGI